MVRAIILDFDGVVADSEHLANSVLADMLSEQGVSTTLEDSYRLYMGKRFDEVIVAATCIAGHPLPVQFAANVQARTLDRFTQELRPVAGVAEYIEAFPELLRCIASSASPERLTRCIEILNLQALSGTPVFSAALVARGKPHPAIFLFAAQQLNVSPAHCIVIEDTGLGVEAARAAGMTVIGLLAASHIRDGHEAKLAAAGAHFIARDFKEAERFTRIVLARSA